MSAGVEAIVAEVSVSRRYRAVARDLIAHLAEIEIARGRRHKDAVKEVKNRLHQVVGAYLDAERPDYAAMLARLESVSQDARAAVCRDLMAGHASSRERLDLLDTFYTTLLAGLPPVRSVVDLACGFNPLAAPFMPLAAGAHYLAIDVLDDLAGFFDAALPLLGVNGAGRSTDCTRVDVLAALPACDVALIIKALPCLAQIDKSAPERILTGIPARTTIVTYPVRSLGGQDKGMRGHYADSFARLTDGRGWIVERFDFDDELAFRVTQPDRPAVPLLP